MKKKLALLCAICAFSLSLGSKESLNASSFIDSFKYASIDAVSSSRVVVEAPDPLTISTKEVDQIRLLLPSEVNVRVVTFQNGKPVTVREKASVVWDEFTSDQLGEDLLLGGKVTYGGAIYDTSIWLNYKEGVRAFAQDLYVEKGSNYALPSTVKVLYSDGDFSNSNSIQWIGTKPSAINTGEFTIAGKANGSLDFTQKIIVHEKSNPNGSNIASQGTFIINWDYSNDSKNDPKKLVNNNRFEESGVYNWAAQNGTKPRQSEYTVNLKFDSQQIGLNKAVITWHALSIATNGEKVPTTMKLSYKPLSSASGWTETNVTPMSDGDNENPSYTFTFPQQIDAQEILLTFTNTQNQWSTLTEFEVYSTSSFVPETKSSNPSIDTIYINNIEISNFSPDLFSYYVTLSDAQLNNLNIRRYFFDQDPVSDPRNKSFYVLINGVPGGAPYKLVNISEDLENHVVYEIYINPVKYSITINGEAEANVQNAAKGEKVTITVKDSKKLFESVSGVEGLTKVSDTEYYFIMPGNDVTINVTVKDAPIAHSITINGEAYSSVETAYKGEEIRVKVKEEGKIFESITGVSGLTKISDSQYSFIMPDENVTITVVVKDKPPVAHRITIQGEAIASVETAIKGEKITITVKEAGKIFESITGVDGLTKVSDTEYYFIMPDADVAITATVKDAPLVQHSITVNGEANVSSSVAIKGEKITVKVREAGKIFDSISGVYGLTKVNDTEYYFIMPDEDVIINVTVKDAPPVQHSITVKGEAYASSSSATKGVKITIKVNDPDKIIESIVGVDGLTKVSDNEYFFIMPDEDVTITVVVKDKPETNHSVIINGDAIASVDKANKGDIVTITLKDKSKVIESITGVEKFTKISDYEYSFVMPDNDVTITIIVKDAQVIEPSIPSDPSTPEESKDSNAGAIAGIVVVVGVLLGIGLLVLGIILLIKFLRKKK